MDVRISNHIVIVVECSIKSIPWHMCARHVSTALFLSFSYHTLLHRRHFQFQQMVLCERRLGCYAQKRSRSVATVVREQRGCLRGPLILTFLTS